MKMKKNPPILRFLILTEGVGLFSGFLSREGIRHYAVLPKSALTPPNWVFPLVWTVLFALMAVGAARVYASEGPGRDRALALFGVQLAVNFVWSLLFFNGQFFGFALLWLAVLWLLILGMIRAFGKVDQTAARLQIPYLLWVTFAAYLNWAVWMLNR